jgi:hypothetical protein
MELEESKICKNEPLAKYFGITLCVRALLDNLIVA